MFAPPFWSASLLAPAGGAEDEFGGAGYGVRTPPLAASFNAELQRRRRDLADAMLYDMGRLGPRSQEALAGEQASPGAVVVATPNESRPLAVYADARRWSLSLDRDARIFALVSPGSSAMAAAVFASDVADALGEAVATLVPPRELPDLTADLSAPLLRSGEAAPQAAPSAELERIRLLQELLAEERAKFELVVCYRLGARWLEASGCSDRTRIVTIGGAAAPWGRDDALHLIGAQDWYGWSISGGAQRPVRVSPFAGGHLNPSLPCAFPLAEALREAAADLGVA